MKKLLFSVLALSFVFALIPLQSQAQGFIQQCGGYETNPNGSYITQSLTNPIPFGWAKLSDTTMAKLQHPCGLCDLVLLVNTIIVFFLRPDFNNPNHGFAVVPIIATIFIIIGGIRIMMGGGNPQAMTQGQNILKSVAIGIAIIYSAWLALSVLFQVLGIYEWTGLGHWWQPLCQ